MHRILINRCLELAAFAVLGLVLLAVAPDAAAREARILNGTWQTAKVPSLNAVPSDVDWKSIEVPGMLQGHNYERAWYRRSFRVEEAWRGQRIHIRFGGVKFNSRVLVNGTEVGECFNGYDAFDVDVTDALRFDGDNELLVGVYDWTGMFSDGHPVLPSTMDPSAVRKIPRDSVLGPVGGRFDLYGIWDDVTLDAVPTVHVAECSVHPSVRQKLISVQITAANSGKDAFLGSVDARVYGCAGLPRDAAGAWQTEGAPLITAPPESVELAPGEQKKISLELADPPLDVWSPDNPKLYVLEVTLTGNGTDRLRERFGFREFWTEGGDFYLNGTKVHLLARSWWPSDQPLSPDEVGAKISMLKTMNVNCFRTHTQPWPQRWYETADELGMLMIPEAAIFTDSDIYRVHDPRFWTAYAQHVKAMIHHLGNHPSVIMWSLGNEFCGPRIVGDGGVEEELAHVVSLAKEVDTRPFLFESDGDPGGAADVVGLHYPNEYPERRQWPNDAFWMDGPNTTRFGEMFWKTPTFLWDRSKPLHIGEFLWVADESPAASSVLFGDEAYKSPEFCHYLAKAELWRMQTLAYRCYGVSGMAPWGYDYIKPEGGRKNLLNAQRDMYRPLAAFLLEFDRRFYSGEAIDRTAELFNDTLSDRRGVQLDWSLLDAGRVVTDGNATVDLAAGAHESIPLRVSLPEVEERTSLSLRLTLNSEGEERFREEWPVDVFPRPTRWALPDVPLYLLDPGSALRTAWTEAGVQFHPLNDVEAWPGDGVLLIGPSSGAQDRPDQQVTLIGRARSRYHTLSAKVQAGGRVLVLEQSQATSDCLPMPLTSLSSTMAFAALSNHPVLRGFQPHDFQCWRGDNMVTRDEPARPIRSGARALLVTGTSQGVSHAPLLEIPQQDGVWLVCQLLAVGKLNTEPVAQPLIEQMVHYLADYKKPAGKTVAVGSKPLQGALDRLGVDYTCLRDWSLLKWPLVRLLIVQVDATTIAAHSEVLSAFIEDGGTVLVHRPSRADVALLDRMLGLSVELQSYSGAVTRAEGDSPLAGALMREDLYWTEPAQLDTRQLAPRASNMTDGVFVSTLDTGTATRIEAEQEVHLDGPFVKTQGGEVVFGSEGVCRWPITITHAGQHTLRLYARGTPAQGVWPLAAIALDDEPLGAIEVTHPDTHAFAFDFLAAQGEHVLSATFSNDGKGPGEDRNLYVDAFSITPRSESGTIEGLAAPAALVRLSKGKGYVTLNALRWDEPGANSLRADRFACSLLDALGARFKVFDPVTVLEAESMVPGAGIAAFTATKDFVLFGANGAVEHKVRIASAGRHCITLWTKGTAADGIFPLVSIRLDGQELGQVKCSGEVWAPCQTEVDLPSGEALLGIAFVNDARTASGDRNLWLDRIEIGRIEEPR